MPALLCSTLPAVPACRSMCGPVRSARPGALCQPGRSRRAGGAGSVGGEGRGWRLPAPPEAVPACRRPTGGWPVRQVGGQGRGHRAAWRFEPAGRCNVPQCPLPWLLAVPVAGCWPCRRNSDAHWQPLPLPALPRLAVPCQPGSSGELIGTSCTCLPAANSHQASRMQALIGPEWQLPARPLYVVAADAVVGRPACAYARHATTCPPVQRCHLCLGQFHAG